MSIANSFFVSSRFVVDCEPRSRMPGEEEEGAEGCWEGQALEEPEEDEPILEEDEYNPKGFDLYPKDPKEEKDGGIRKDFDMKFDFEML